MSNSIHAAQAVSPNGIYSNGAATVTPLPVGIGARTAVVMERRSVTPAPRRSEAPMFVDTAHTVLPIEFQGKEVILEAHAYEDESVSYQAMAVVHRQEGVTAEAPLVRVHSGCVTGDIFHSLRCDCYQQLQKALERITNSAHGIIIYLPHHEGRGIGLVNKIKAYAEQDRGLDTVDANLSIGAPVDARDYELAAKILKDLGTTEIRLMTNNPLKVEAMRDLGITVVEQVPHVVTPSRFNQRYLNTKKERMAHKL
jgi:GTP cyclohydrolase II/3,4-dihydroxy 2-butanone 4-phosphate synthase/GTP cyclohydrolase II